MDRFAFDTATLRIDTPASFPFLWLLFDLSGVCGSNHKKPTQPKSSKNKQHCVTMTTASYDKYIVPFGGSAPSVPNPSKDILGGKGLGLQEMSSLNIDVPRESIDIMIIVLFGMSCLMCTSPSIHPVLSIYLSIIISCTAGFTMVTSLCGVYEKEGDLPDALWALVDQHVARVERDMGRRFGDASGVQPLLFSCRSGAKIRCVVKCVMHVVQDLCTVDLEFALLLPKK